MCKKAGSSDAAAQPRPFRNPPPLPGLPRRPDPRRRRYPGLRLRLSRAQRGRSLQPAARRPARRTLSRRSRRRDRFLAPQPHRAPGRWMVRTGGRLRQQVPLDRPAGHCRAATRPRRHRSGCAFVGLRTNSSSPRASRWWKSGPMARAWRSNPWSAWDCSSSRPIFPKRKPISIEIAATPAWTVAEDDRTFTVNISMIRLVDAES